MKTFAWKARLLVSTAAIAALLAACSADENTPPTRITPSAPAQATQAPVVAAPATMAGSVVTQPLVEKAKPHEVVADATAEIAITLNGDSIAANHTSVSVNGSKAQITAPGNYRLSGALTNGQISVNTAEKGAVRLILAGVTLHNESGAAIDIIDADTAVIALADNTQNTVSDGATYVFADPGVDEPNAALFSKKDLTIEGSGTLTVQGNFNDGITSKDGLVIAGGVINVTAADDGIRGKDYVVVQDGALMVTAKGDGLKSDDAEDAAKGYIAIQKGTLAVTAGGDAIAAHTDVLLSDGTYTLNAGGGSNTRPTEGVSAKGIKAGVNLTIDGGQFAIDASDDALHTNGSMTINNGTFNLATADDGAHADVALVINGGTVRVTKSYEGLESVVVTLNGGEIDVVSSDDGINVADGTGGGPGGGRGPRPGRDAATYTGNKFLYINGGSITVNSGGDGVDANGAVEMKGGTLLVHGPPMRMNSALDFDAFFNISGGTVVAAGSSGMAQSPGAGSQQPSVLIFFDAAQQAGTLVHIRGSDGQALVTFASKNEFQALAFSSPALVQGATYEVVLGGSADGTVANGLYANAAYSAGTVFQSFTVNSVVTTVGNGNQRRFGPLP